MSVMTICHPKAGMHVQHGRQREQGLQKAALTKQRGLTSLNHKQPANKQAQPQLHCLRGDGNARVHANIATGHDLWIQGDSKPTQHIMRSLAGMASLRVASAVHLADATLPTSCTTGSLQHRPVLFSCTGHRQACTP